MSFSKFVGGIIVVRLKSSMLVLSRKPRFYLGGTLTATAIMTNSRLGGDYWSLPACSLS